MTAYVLIQKQSSDTPLAESLREIPGIESAVDTTGAYDAIAVARSDSSGELADVVVSEIRRLPGVTHALLAPLTKDVALGYPSVRTARTESTLALRESARP
jgi:hypothetical protein